MCRSKSKLAVRGSAIRRAALVALIGLLTSGFATGAAAREICASEECRRVQAQSLTNLIDLGEFAQAVEYYGSLYSGLPSRESAAYRDLLLGAALGMAESGGCKQTVILLTAYTETFSSDVDALASLAHCAGVINRHDLQIDALGRAVNNSIDSGETVELWNRLFRALDTELALLHRRRDVDGQITLLGDMIYRWPDRPLFYIRLADVYAGLGDSGSVNATLDGMPWSSEFAQQAAALRRGARVGSAETGTVAEPQPDQRPGVPLIRHGAQYVVNATINRRTTVRMLIDTGASISSIRPAIAAQLDPAYREGDRQVRLATANGFALAHTVEAHRVSVNGKTVTNLLLAAVELGGNDEIDGLLGMDFLRHFEFSIDQTRAVLLLSR